MNYIKIFILMLFFGISMAGCESFLDPNPDNQNPYSRLLWDPAFAEGLLTNGYTRLPGSGSLPYTFDDVATDNAVSNDVQNPYRRMATGELSALYNPLDDWATCYAAIYNINYFMTMIDKVDWSWQNDRRDALFARRMRGDAFALRAVFYQRLLSHYGGRDAGGTLLGVPLILTDLNVDDNWQVPRSTFQQTLDQINADYDSALNYLPYVYKDNPADLEWTRVFGARNNGRIQGKIIKALRCQLALTIASPIFNGGEYDETKCATAATMVSDLIDSIGGISALPSDGVEFYNTDGDATNADLFWRRDYFTSYSQEQQNFPPSSYGYGRTNPSQNLVDAFPALNGYPITDLANSGYNPLNPYSNRDPRLKKYIITHGSSYKGVTMNMSPQNTTNNDGLNKLPEYSTRTGYYLAKLMRSDASANPTSTTVRRHFYTFIRYTELYLLFAEAANEAWGPDGDGGTGYTARAVIAQIRKRAGITQPDNYLAGITTKEAMRDLIRNERRLELCFEGHRFWDMRRWMLDLNETVKGVNVVLDGSGAAIAFEKIDVEARNYPEDVYYMPIPQTEILKYTALKQNAGW